MMDMLDKPTTITLLRKANEYVTYIKARGQDLEMAKMNAIKENADLQERILHLQRQLKAMQDVCDLIFTYSLLYFLQIINKEYIS